MRIAIISVAPPYRGGISKHTSLLAEKLSIDHSVDIINYSRQYPDFLFPGKTQYLDNYIQNETNFRWIDSINPYSWFITGNKLADKKYDLIIFRFWHPFFAPALATIANILKRKSPNLKLISLCDNILPHEKTPLEKFLIKLLFGKMDAHIVMSSETEFQLKIILNSPIYKRLYLPLYTNFPPKIDKQKARNILGIVQKNIILYFGIIRYYKGFDILLEAVSILKNNNLDFHLIAVGECYDDDKKYINLIAELEISKFVTWHNKYIPDSEVSNYFSAADVVALPYRSASQSGIAKIAYNFNLPIIVTNVGGLAEIVDDGRTGFIIKRENPDDLSRIIETNFIEGKFVEMGSYINRYKRKFSWKNFIRGIENLYFKL